jgi:putative flippase GtrA
MNAATIRAEALRFLRSSAAGLVATAFDIGTLTLLVSIAHTSPRIASIPALLMGNIAMYFGQKYFAFRSHADAKREVPLFILVQGIGFALNIGLYDFVIRTVSVAASYYVVARLVTSNVIYCAYSYPLWHLVFKKRSAE